MKKILFTIVGACIIFILSYFVVQIFQKAEEQQLVKENREEIPIVVLQDMTGKEFSTQNIPIKDFTLFIFFNPDCHFCQLKAEEMQKKANEFNKFNIYFISTTTEKEIQNFSEKYNLNKTENINFLHDGFNTFSTTVGANTVPFLMLYSDNRLIKTYKGSVKLDLVLEDAKKYRKTGS